MADSNAMKNKRTHCRTKTTKSINYARKLVSEDYSTVKVKELETKIQAVKVAMDEHSEVHQAYVGLLVNEGKSATDIDNEEKANELIESGYEAELEKLEECVIFCKIYLQDTKIQRSAALWLKNSVCESATFAVDGNKRREELETLIGEMTPYKANPYFAGQLTKAEQLSEELSAKLFASHEATAATDKATSKAAATPQAPPPYKIKPPSFSGRPREFAIFKERFGAIMDAHKDYYSESDKLSILAEAMEDADAKRLVLNCYATGYEEAMKELQANYGRKTVIFPQLVDELIRKEKYDYTRESMKMVLDRSQRVLGEMDKLGAKNIEMLTVALVVKDFDAELLTEWTKHLGSDDSLPTLTTLTDFATPLSHNLPKRARSVTAQPVHRMQQKQQVRPVIPAPVVAEAKPESQSQKKQCTVCKDGQHPLYRCKKFKDATISQRWNIVNKNKLCSNCLHHSHQLSSCTSTYVCRHCRQKHNYLLHRDTDDEKKPINTGVTLAAQAAQTHPEGKQTVELGCGFIHTALITIKHQGKKITARAALDSCATHSLLSEKVASFLQPQRQPVNITMKGAVAEKQLKHWSTVTVSTVQPSAVEIPVGVVIAPSLPSATPPEKPSEIAKHKLLQGLVLADPEFGGQLDMIIGTNDLPLFWVEGDRKFSAEARMTAVNTVFGWTVSGPATTAKKSEEMIALKVELTEDEDTKLFKSMYQLEKVPTASVMTAEEKSAVTQFQNSVEQGDDGRYSCKLPKVANPPEVGESKAMAKARFMQNERKMLKLKSLEPFNEEMNSYLTMKHAEVVPSAELENGKFYLPVQGVIKPDSTSTKIRPVFDGSAKSTNGYSLNDLYLAGPNLYPLIADVLLKFRSHPVAFSADISKMYREIELHKDDRDHHRFFIRTQDGKLMIARMTRLTFGIRPSPFIATSVIRLHAQKNQDKFPEASKAIMESFYVDDFLSGASTVNEAKQIQKSLCELLSQAGMTLKKWRSSSTELLDSIPSELIEKEDRKDRVRSDALKALGIHWDAALDALFVTTPTSLQKGKVTKRGVARLVAGIYDVLGLVAPYVITGKILLQSLWEKQIGWDQEIPAEMLADWQKWLNELHVVKCYPIPRFTGAVSDIKHVTLHGFADSSCKAFAAAVYIRIQNVESTACCSLLCCKARVKPLKSRTLPELELEAAKMLAQLLSHVASVLHVPLSSSTCWSDSMIVLAWLQKPLYKLKTFVANRVALIHELLPDVKWKHVNSECNPADLPTRGVSAGELVKSELWWHGPKWLCEKEVWQNGSVNVPDDQLPGMKTTVLVAVAMATKSDWSLWVKYSSYIKLTRIVAWLLKFYNGCKKKMSPPTTTTSLATPSQPVLTFDDLQCAELTLIRLQQQESFPVEWCALSKGKNLVKVSSLGGLCVMMHHDNQVLIGKGRVGERTLIPLSAKHQLTKLMLMSQHKLHSHASVSTLMSIMGNKFYIIGIKNQLKKVAKACVKCQQINANTLTQQMGMLPSIRTTLQPPFSITGIDFAGPVTLKEGATRKPVYFKSYLCLFICMTTRCIHIEICRSLETADFMAALKRFTNRRGSPCEIFTDNGSNFIGAANEIKKIQQLMSKSQQQMSMSSSVQQIKWHFNPPRAPHFGGLWEAGVKIMKKLMKKIVEPHPLKLDELTNVVTEIEALMNSRPLVTAEKVESEEGLVLTPAHFLIFRPMKSPATQSAPAAKISSLRRWQLVQRLCQDFEIAWKGSYLQSLQSRSKWKVKQRNPKEGEIVYLKDETLMNRNRWPLEKIVKLYPGKDNLVRAVDVLSGGKIYKRSIHVLVPLHLEHDEETEK